MDKADEFAIEIFERLRKIEKIRGRDYESLQARCDHLNMNGIFTIRNKRWTKTQMSRVLKRAENVISIF